MLYYENLIMDILRTSPKTAAWLTLLFCAGLLLFALALQYFVALTPCPLCIVQRFFFLLIGLTAVGYLSSMIFFKERVTGLLIIIFSLTGGAVAARQVWMQHFPESVDSTRCVVYFGSFIQSVIYSLGGSGNCSVVDWTFLTLSIAEWSLCSFSFLLIVGIWFASRSPKATPGEASAVTSQ